MGYPPRTTENQYFYHSLETHQAGIPENNLSNDAELWAAQEGQRVEGKNVLANKKSRMSQRECNSRRDLLANSRGLSR